MFFFTTGKLKYSLRACNSFPSNQKKEKKKNYNRDWEKQTIRKYILNRNS